MTICEQTAATLEERKIRAEERDRVLAELANYANLNHEQRLGTGRKMLDHAREAGTALLLARRLLGGRSKWAKWRRANFKGSVESARVYARIAKNWNDPRMVQARLDGLDPESIRGFLAILSGKIAQPKKEEERRPRAELQPDALQYDRDALLKRIKEKLTRIDKAIELEVLSATFEDHWRKLQREVRDWVCVILEHDPYETAEERDERVAARKRAQRALNRNRKADG